MCKDLDIVAVIKNEKLEWLERMLRIGPWRSGQEDVWEWSGRKEGEE